MVCASISMLVCNERKHGLSVTIVKMNTKELISDKPKTRVAINSMRLANACQSCKVRSRIQGVQKNYLLRNHFFVVKSALSSP